MMTAWFLHDRQIPPKISHLAVIAVLIAVPTILIAKQPDLGTSLLIAASGIIVILLAGMSFKLIFGLGVMAIPGALVLWNFMQDYQKQRVLTLLNPDSDPLGAGYNIIQSKIAIGSGGLFGKGWTNGSQAHLEFLPERHTDFIFAVLGEEFGLLGVLTLLILYMFVIGRGLYIAVQAHDTYSRLLAGSISLTFLVYVFVNTAMVTGLIPVVGVPLPLVSFGGTSMVTLMAGFGILMSIHSTSEIIPTLMKPTRFVLLAHPPAISLPRHRRRYRPPKSSTGKRGRIYRRDGHRPCEFDRDALSAVLAKAQVKQNIIKKISTPAERTLTWGEYRKIFITKERINVGATFWQDNKEMLERIALETGVSIEILVGIIGVETYFGRITGKDRVIDALATLAFEYPPRSKFFRNELMQFLILAREESLDPTVPMGSYAGAMGRPQFMPSSFRAYAVDATGDDKRDIWNNWADVSGSIANYFLEHGWRKSEEIAAQATLGTNWRGAVPNPKNTLKASKTTVRKIEQERRAVCH